MFAVVLWEGCVTGVCYGNTFARVSNEVRFEQLVFIYMYFCFNLLFIIELLLMKLLPL